MVMIKGPFVRLWELDSRQGIWNRNQRAQHREAILAVEHAAGFLPIRVVYYPHCTTTGYNLPLHVFLSRALFFPHHDPSPHPDSSTTCRRRRWTSSPPRPPPPQTRRPPRPPPPSRRPPPYAPPARPLRPRALPKVRSPAPSPPRRSPLPPTPTGLLASREPRGRHPYNCPPFPYPRSLPLLPKSPTLGWIPSVRIAPRCAPSPPQPLEAARCRGRTATQRSAIAWRRLSSGSRLGVEEQEGISARCRDLTPRGVHRRERRAGRRGEV
ncbi:hypothetical protein PAHAL_2G484400 [Panicum hallii]|uniref:Uncharacterized protein n=1 Tax=Panicum hallii TaxID=206008 RepID=A0A2T8KTB1_9POAL|nr:hypothetical protein PAHAL_2G484400 [Panicum hallii]